MPSPLTRQRPSGALYKRPPDIDAEIDRALAMSESELRGRLDPTDRDRQLSLECCVHLLRAAHRRGDVSFRDAVFTALLKRVDRCLVRVVPGYLPNAEHTRENVRQRVAEIFAKSLYRGDDRLDMYECRFRKVLRARVFDVQRQEGRHLGDAISLSDYEGGAGPDDDTHGARLPDELKVPPEQLDLVTRHELARAIEKLPADQKKALLLVEFMGFKVESNDPQEITAATLCNCKGRTIRYRLARAAKTLKTLLEPA
jgi:hypothetical protein